MGCNCKRKKQVTNNLDSPDYIIPAKESFTQLSTKKIEDFDAIDQMEVKRIYLSLYPNSKGTTSTEQMMMDIKTAIEIYDVKYRRT